MTTGTAAARTTDNENQNSTARTRFPAMKITTTRLASLSRRCCLLPLYFCTGSLTLCFFLLTRLLRKLLELSTMLFCRGLLFVKRFCWNRLIGGRRRSSSRVWRQRGMGGSSALFHTNPAFVHVHQPAYADNFVQGDESRSSSRARTGSSAGATVDGLEGGPQKQSQLPGGNENDVLSTTSSGVSSTNRVLLEGEREAQSALFEQEDEGTRVKNIPEDEDQEVVAERKKVKNWLHYRLFRGWFQRQDPGQRGDFSSIAVEDEEQQQEQSEQGRDRTPPPGSSQLVQQSSGALEVGGQQEDDSDSSRHSAHHQGGFQGGEQDVVPSAAQSSSHPYLVLHNLEKTFYSLDRSISSKVQEKKAVCGVDFFGALDAGGAGVGPLKNRAANNEVATSLTSGSSTTASAASTASSSSTTTNTRASSSSSAGSSPGGQIFGLLGLNGAGKTTTFKMMLGLETPTRGEVYILPGLLQSSSSSRDHDKVPYEYIGYCPQFDTPLFSELTVLENLNIYRRLKQNNSTRAAEADFSTTPPPAVELQTEPSSSRARPATTSTRATSSTSTTYASFLKRRMQSLIVELDLEPYLHKKCYQLSGGNKRKTCVAIALLSKPKLLFLDEPSTGMDAVAKRNLWRCLQKYVQLDRTLCILTTHSMEEAEFLCHRIAIQVEGRWRCLGSVNRLRQVYGGGYEAIVEREKIRSTLSGMSMSTSLISGGRRNGAGGLLGKNTAGTTTSAAEVAVLEDFLEELRKLHPDVRIINGTGTNLQLRLQFPSLGLMSQQEDHMENDSYTPVDGSSQPVEARNNKLKNTNLLDLAVLLDFFHSYEKQQEEDSEVVRNMSTTQQGTSTNLRASLSQMRLEHVFHRFSPGAMS
ncbi:unnamed protein product [Amoebophrya sp. A120]|nr:unnamed protein product [Amoebophrya sp. A120]|eukprot:GSA120T00015581001.1